MRRARTRARSRSWRAAAAAALSLVILLGAGVASAQAGPGVVFKREQSGDQRRVFGSQIGGGLSIRGLLDKARIDPALVQSVTVAGDDGNAIQLSGADFDSAFVSDIGNTTRFFRTGRPDDDVRSVGAQPLAMAVNGSALLSIELTVDKKRVDVGEEVTLTAGLRGRPPGAQYTYTWNFGDGTPSVDGAELRQVRHSYESSANHLVTVTVDGSGGPTAQCEPSCSAQASIEVEVTGEERRSDQPQGFPQGGEGGTGPAGAGSGGTGTGTGTGDGSGDAAGTGGDASAPSKAAPKAPPLRAQRPEPKSTFSADPASGEGKVVVEGVLLADRGRNLKGGLPQNKAGGSPRAAKGVPGVVAEPLGIGASFALALAIVSMGALRERRRVRLRVA